MSKSSRRTSKQDSQKQQDKQDTKQSQESQAPLQGKVAQYQADYAKWATVAAQPNIPPQVAQVAWNLARSSKAALTLGQKALLYQEPESVQESQSGPPAPEIGPQQT